METIAKDAYCCAQQGKRKTLQRRDLDNAIEAVDEFAFLEGTLDWLWSWMIVWAFAAPSSFPVQASTSESLPVTQSSSTFSSCMKQSSLRAFSTNQVFHYSSLSSTSGLDIAAAGRKDSTQWLTEQEDQSEGLCFVPCFLESCLCSCPVTGEPGGQAQTFHQPSWVTFLLTLFFLNVSLVCGSIIYGIPLFLRSQSDVLAVLLKYGSFVINNLNCKIQWDFFFWRYS